MRMPNGKKPPGTVGAGVGVPVLRASPRRNAIRSAPTATTSTNTTNRNANTGVATDLVKKLDNGPGSQKQKPTAGAGVTNVQPQANTSTSTSTSASIPTSTSTSSSTSTVGSRSVLLPSHNPNSNSLGPNTQQSHGEQQTDGDVMRDGNVEQRRGEDMPLQVQESGSVSVVSHFFRFYASSSFSSSTIR